MECNPLYARAHVYARCDLAIDEHLRTFMMVLATILVKIMVQQPQWVLAGGMGPTPMTAKRLPGAAQPDSGLACCFVVHLHVFTFCRTKPSEAIIRF